MDIAFSEAEKALSLEEVPIGCAILYQGHCLEKAHNLTNTRKDPLAHAEMIALARIPPHLYPEIELFITCEPCIMCCALIHKLGVQKVTFACTNTRFGGISVFSVSKLFPNLEIKITQDISQAKKSLDLLKTFYQLENTRAPPTKRKFKPQIAKKICNVPINSH
ncbi:tRNA-specific adenosine deaminase 2 [Nematocida homosporus]|uniref:tRNA-specific adenosine deaminase 2 n=1 Tax=Nematocida homosporus TaxID=1912981 RepID=UPI00221E4639|nr:tRNA-specific adenosine deaminase 2 [Nematocida homosporus]KAI5185868.1 tRNA-specific adenosine deaminase 2 [Nematocida homosporus]